MSVVANVAINVDSSGAVSKLRQVQTQAQSTEKAFGALQSAIGALGVGFALTKVIADVKELDTNLRRLGTVGGNVGELNKGLGDLSDRLGGVANKAELAAASYQALSAGFTETGANLRVVEAATKAAVGGLADITGVVDVTTKVLNSYNMSGDQATKVTDSISKAVELGQVQWSDYTSQLGRVASIAAIAGVSLDEVNAFVAAATKNGATAEVAFTGLGASLATIIKPTTESAKAAAALGINWTLAGLRGEGFESLMGQLAKAMESNTEKATEMVGGQEAVRGAFASASKGGKDYAMILEGLGGAAGKTDADFQTMKGSLENTLKALDTSFKNFSEALGKAFGPTVVIAVQDITKAVNGFASIMNTIPQPVLNTTGQIIKLIAQMLLLQKAFQAIIGIRAAFIGAMVGMTGATAASGAAAKTSAGSMALYTNNTKTLAAQSATATPLVAGLKNALQGLAAIGIITVGINLVTTGLSEFIAAQTEINRLRGLREGGGVQLVGGATQTRENVIKKQKTAQKTVTQTTGQKAEAKKFDPVSFFLGPLAPLVGGKTQVQKADAFRIANEKQLNAQAILGLSPSAFKPATPPESQLPPPTGAIPPADGAGSAAASNADKAAKKELSDAKKAADLVNKLTLDFAQKQIQIDGQVFDNQVNLDKLRFDLQQQLQDKQFSNFVNKFTGVAKEQAGIIQSMLMGSTSFDAQIKDLEDKIKQTQQKLKTDEALNKAQQRFDSNAALNQKPTTQTGGGFLVGSTGRSSGPHLDLRGNDREGVVREALSIIKEFQKMGLPYIELPNAKINVKNMTDELQLLKALRQEQRAHDVTRGRPIGASQNAIDIAVPSGTKVPVLAGPASQQGAAGFTATSLATGNRMLHGLPQSRAGGGGIAATGISSGMAMNAPSQNVDQTKKEIQGLTQQLALLKSQSKSFTATDLAAGVLASTSAFREQTAQIGMQSEAFTLRNRLQMEGVKPEVIEGELKLLEIKQQLNDRLQPFNELLAAGKMTQEQYAAATNEIKVAAEGAATAIRDYTAATVAASSPIQQFITSSTTQLKDLESVAVRVSQGIGDAVGNAMTNGVQGLIEGTTSAKQVFADFLKTVGDILMQEAAKMIATYMAIATAKALAGLSGAPSGGSASQGFRMAEISPGFGLGPQRMFGGGKAAGGPVSSNSTYMVGERGPELFVPGSNGMIVPAGPTAGIREAMASGANAATAPVLNMSFETTRIGNTDYVSREQLEAAMMQTRAEATRAGARRGMTMTLDKLQQSPSTRSRVGLG